MRQKLTKKFKIEGIPQKSNGGTHRGLYCSPARNSTSAYSCYSLKNLNTFARNLNIPFSSSKQNKAELWNKIDSKLNSECNTIF
jgi:hypothetical protein